MKVLFFVLRKPKMTFNKVGSAKEFRLGCLTNKGQQMGDMDDESCMKAVERSFSVRPTIAILVMSIENGVELLTTDRKLTTRFKFADIAFCFVSEQHPDVFAFICRRKEDIFCNAFICSSEQEARKLYGEMSSLFNLAGQLDKQETHLKMSRLKNYKEEASFLGWTRKGKAKMTYNYEEWDAESEEDGLMRCQ